MLPKSEQEEPQPLDDQQVATLLDAAKDTPMEQLILVAPFTGLRLSELLGLTWDAVNFGKGMIMISQQLSRPEHRSTGLFPSPKSGKVRTIAPATAVFDALKHQRSHQAEQQLKAGPLWDAARLVFTVENGGPVDQWRAEKAFRNLLFTAGLSGFHFHSLRHPNVKSKTKIS